MPQQTAARHLGGRFQAGGFQEGRREVLEADEILDDPAALTGPGQRTASGTLVPPS